MGGVPCSQACDPSEMTLILVKNDLAQTQFPSISCEGETGFHVRRAGIRPGVKTMGLPGTFYPMLQLGHWIFGCTERQLRSGCSLL